MTFHPFSMRLIIVVAAVASFLTPALHLTAVGQGKNVATADISARIKKHIEAETKKASDGKFHVNYLNKDLALDLVKVHEDRLYDLGDGHYAACVDMNARNGKIYDIDFYLAGQSGEIKVTQTTVHKVEGKPRYNWKEKEGKWDIEELFTNPQ